MVSSKVEDQILKENIKDAIAESKLPESNGKIQGYVGIVIGIIGFFVPVFFAVFTGMITAVLGIYSNKHGQRKLGIICGILALLNLMSFFVLSVAKFPF